MSLPSEDYGIVLARQHLERYWLDALDDAQRADWVDHWATTPPQDVSGNVYVPHEPAALHQIQVEPATCYAWSQIYATYRMRYGPKATRPTQLQPLPVIAAVSVSATVFEVSVRNADDSATPQAVILYASRTAYPGQFVPRYNLRPIEWFTARAMPATVSIRARYVLRYGAPSVGAVVYVRAAAIGTDNSHLISADIAEAEVAA